MAITGTIGIVGFSGSGKTTLAAKLIERLVAEGLRVAVMKHTHHALNSDRRGDTDVLTQAGADPVLLCRAGEAVEFSRDAVRRVRYESVEDLRSTLQADVVILEGFKASGHWPRLVVWSDRDEHWVEWRQAVAVVAHGAATGDARHEAASRDLPFFEADQIEELRTFLARIASR